MYQFGIVGCGRIAQRHAENIQKVGKLVAVCDIVPEKAEALAHTFGCKAYCSIEEMLQQEKDIDIVSVCTPNGLHAEHSIKSLQAGKHVLCEKPMCLTSAAAWQMIETEKYSRKKLFVVKSTRYNPLLLQLKRLLDEKKLGRIYSFHLSCLWNRPNEYYTDWHGKLFPDGGTLYTQFSHYIDAMLWIFGTIEQVKGFRTNTAHTGSIDFEDTGAASLLMNDDVVGSIHWSVNTYRKNFEISLTIIAEKGTIRLGGEYLNEVQYQVTENLIEFETREGSANDYQFYKGSMSNHTEVYQNLVLALQDKDSAYANSFDGLRTVEAIEKIYKAMNLIQK